MRVFHVGADSLTELDALPEQLATGGYLWIGCARSEFEARIELLQAALLRWTGGQLVELHVSDLKNEQLPSNFDYTSWYDLLVFRRLAAGRASRRNAPERAASAHEPGRSDAAHGQPHGRRLPGIAPPADTRTRSSAAGAA